MRPPAGPSTAAPSPAAKGDGALALIRLLRSAVAAAAPRDALLVRMGALRRSPGAPQQRRAAEDALDLLRGAGRVRLFTLPNADVVAVGPRGAEAVRGAEAALRALLAPGHGGPARPPVALLRLPDEAAALFAAVEAALAPPAPGARTEAGASADIGGDATFGSDELASVERVLAGADLSSFLRQRPVCRLGPGDPGPAVAWREWRVSVPAVLSALSPGCAAGAWASEAPWLLRRLRRTLDRRLLAVLARPDRAVGLGAAALCLVPGSVLSPEFARFAEALGPSGRAAVAVGVLPADVLADPAGFAAARDACRARGFRAALFEADADALRLLPPERLGLDLLGLRWSPGLPSAAALLPPGREGVVLAGADTAAAIGWGWEQGVALFEGRLLRPRGG